MFVILTFDKNELPKPLTEGDLNLQLLDDPYEKLPDPACIALGRFDGVHIGHTAVIRRAASFRASGLTAVVAAFSPFAASSGSLPGSPRIITDSLRNRAFADCGAEILIRLDFEEIRSLSPEEFVRDVLRDRLHAKAVCCGFNYRFGKNRHGTADLLQALATRYGMEVSVVAPVLYEGEAVSSSRIRQCIADGDMESARAMLSRPFSYDFPVSSGDRRGRLLGAPTINQIFSPDFIRPKFGVYASRAYVDGQYHAAVTNFGVRPTIGTDTVLSETCIMDYQGDLYGQPVEVGLIRFLRKEVRFQTLDELSRQIHEDAQTSREVYSSHERV